MHRKLDRTNKCSTNAAIYQDSRHGQDYTNIMQEADRAGKCKVNTDIISKFKNKDKSMGIDNEPKEISDFLQVQAKIMTREWVLK